MVRRFMKKKDRERLASFLGWLHWLGKALSVFESQITAVFIRSVDIRYVFVNTQVAFFDVCVDFGAGGGLAWRGKQHRQAATFDQYHEAIPFPSCFACVLVGSWAASGESEY